MNSNKTNSLNKNKSFSFGIDKAIFYSVIAVFTMQFVGGMIQLPTFFYPVLTSFLLPISFFSGIVIAIGLLLVLVKSDFKQIIGDLKTKFSVTELVLTIFIWLGFLPLCEFLTTLVPITGILEGLYQYFETTLSLMLNYKIGAFITICILAPIFEEILFRGIILKGMLNFKINPGIAIGISGLIFGLAHLNPWQFVGAGLLGSLFGFVYYRTKSLVLPIILHALNNSLSFSFILLNDTSKDNIFDVSNYMMIGIFTFLGLMLSYILYQITTKKQ